MSEAHSTQIYYIALLGYIGGDEEVMEVYSLIKFLAFTLRKQYDMLNFKFSCLSQKYQITYISILLCWVFAEKLQLNCLCIFYNVDCIAPLAVNICYSWKWFKNKKLQQQQPAKQKNKKKPKKQKLNKGDTA